MRDKKKEKEKRGRKVKNPRKDAVYVNWMTLLLWPIIEEAARHPSAGPRMSTTAIKKRLQTLNPTLFAKLSRTTIEGWMDRSGDKPRWSEKTLARAERGNFQGHANGGRRGVLVSFILVYPPYISHIVVPTGRISRDCGHRCRTAALLARRRSPCYSRICTCTIRRNDP
jgi:hypothetical protein